MNEYWFFGISFIVWAVQMVLCFFCKKLWLRILPMILAAVLAGGSLLFYFLSGGSNWAWLILLALFGWFLLAVAAAWMVFCLYRLVKKVLRF